MAARCLQEKTKKRKQQRKEKQRQRGRKQKQQIEAKDERRCQWASEQAAPRLSLQLPAQLRGLYWLPLSQQR